MLAALPAASCRGERGAEHPQPEGAPSASTPASSSSVVMMPIDLLLPSMPTGKPPSNAPLPPPEERPPCAKDEDCWSWTCCPATNPDHCVHSSLAQKCALVDMTCAKTPPGESRYDCVCDAGKCAGRLHP